MPANNPPTPGPKIKPKPIHIPTKPMYFVRSSLVVMSATILVVAVYNAPEAAPPIILLIYKIGKLSMNKPNMRKLNANVDKPPINNGRRPILSDKRPKNGADKKLAKEYMASKSPICIVLTPSWLTSSGITGMIILKPK